MRTFAIGDIHGAYRALMQCLNRANFDKKKDRLICLGDVADGWSEVVPCIEELLKIKNLVYIIGNHDAWLIDWLARGKSPYIWTSQGGGASIKSYLSLPDDLRGRVMRRHIKFFRKGVYYFVDEDNRLYVHGGFNYNQPIDETSDYDKTWDRDLYITVGYRTKAAKSSEYLVKDYKEVFIGHTTTSRYDPKLNPVNFENLWNLDQGAGWEGKLTIMDVVTKEYWQSDIVKDLYPEEKGRR